MIYLIKWNTNVLNQWWNNYGCWCESNKHQICEQHYVWNSIACICENGKYLARIIDDSVITCDEIIDVEETGFNEKNYNFITL